MADQTTTIPKGWKMTTLGEVADNVEYGYTESAINEKIGPKFLRITDIQNDFIDWKNVPYCPISNKDFEKYKLSVGDIVVARTGNSTGATAIIKDDVEAVFASYLIRFKLNKERADFKYIAFLLRSNFWKKFVVSIKGGSAQGGANAKDFSTFTIQLPPLPEQRAIAAVLSSFDDKIDLLRDQNKTLEAAAQTIFKEWFVNFNFPDADGKPYKTSGGKMIDSELGEIPEGWKVEKLGNIVNIVYGKNLPTTNLQVDGFPVFGGNGQIGFFDKYLYKEQQVLVSCRGEASGKVNISLPNSFVTNNSLILEITENSTLNFNFLKFFSLNTDYTIYVSGSAQPQITIETIKYCPVLLPPKNILDLFNQVINPFTKKNLLNLSQIKTLSTLRDTLLPKLMKGEVRVKGFLN